MTVVIYLLNVLENYSLQCFLHFDQKMCVFNLNLPYKLVHSEMKIQMHCYDATAKHFCQFNTCPLSTTFDVKVLIQKPSLTTYRSLHNSKYLFYTMYKYLGNQLPHFFTSKMIHFTFSVTKTDVTFQCTQ
jgi:hypothetical protein